MSATPVPGSPAPPRWPHQLLDVGALRAGGWRPVPLRDFVLKVHQRCNLACDYCYVYELADQSWRGRPAVMPAAVRRATVARIADHVRRHRLPRISVSLHGGEPLLAGPRDLLTLVDDLRARLPGHCTARIGLQTNGVLLDESAVRALAGHGIRIGVSIDGTAADHDRHRRHRNGTGSHTAAARALALLREPRHRAAYAGLLCTIDPATDPVGTYEALLRHEPPAIDFLLPHANWAHPPAHPPGAGPAPYGDWLVAVFDRWYDDGRREPSVRLFDQLIGLLLGAGSRSDQIGLSPVTVAVVESDGAIEQVDSLKSAYEGAASTGLSVLGDTFDAALEHPGVVARQIGAAALGDACRRCPLHPVCGAGHYAHRYRAVEGFHNPSVYCADLTRLITHVRTRLAADLARLRKPSDVDGTADVDGTGTDGRVSASGRR
ncbi:FxsB family cyclophane-forming radical SAM/SPASM peptide maturase [Krasilnikovia sp. MM14-A1259]|uniref:FxsB family cyclophane-forming radical SAM/SPASM peptide maturase n=1 Tax=Krasilnikovia sp. MM14-A1259 TaxID=3373539 RepID=UPI0037FE8458